MSQPTENCNASRMRTNGFSAGSSLLWSMVHTLKTGRSSSQAVGMAGDLTPSAQFAVRSTRNALGSLATASVAPPSG